ncbi:hypothetical protein BEWA_028000 [Theileria equi strain WA]|uniref:RecQ mediated genome instability protein 1 OB-fold domain-containing protein n=1 Tax=Theileria equi strain WA TaxID=1537102 RepID=L0AY74_THEEQ|nr:hypothetical protein BEWA_028000 [Theileria equi strain WA]AFZ79951.1 hypothetical protein BEWA_028000 [Theileria equi strain WA]|eukprot:XP_004829617.1 hypothetical protein BEWA_028000 [Theileria equi strain WA]
MQQNGLPRAHNPYENSSELLEHKTNLFNSIIRQNWLYGVDYADIRGLCKDSVTIYQVIDFRDISKPSHRSEDDSDDEDQGDDNTKTTYAPKYHKANRMLKITLFDGVSYHTAFEYEPIAALDVFNVTGNNHNSVRCCGKIALYNSPVFRRNAYWLNKTNVKLLFEGYICKIHNEDSPAHEICHESNPEMSSENGISSRVIELASQFIDTEEFAISMYNSSLPTTGSSLDSSQNTSTNISFSGSKKDVTTAPSLEDTRQTSLSISGHTFSNRTAPPVTPNPSTECITIDDTPVVYDLTGENDSQLTYIHANNLAMESREPSNNKNFKTYFPEDSKYQKFSFVSFLNRRPHAATDNKSFLEFSKERLATFTSGIGISIRNFCNVLRESTGILNNKPDLKLRVGDITCEYKFGFLNHSTPLYAYPENSLMNRVLSDLVNRVFRTTFGSKFWLGIFDDCISSFFCIFSLETFIPFVTLPSTMDNLTISQKLNSIEGFFLLEDFNIEDTNIIVLRGYTPNLPSSTFNSLSKVITENFKHLQYHMDF